MRRRFSSWAVLLLLLLSLQGAAQPRTYDPAEQVLRMRKAVAHYERLAALQQWISLEEKVCLNNGAPDACHQSLRENLQLTGDLPGSLASIDSVYDEQLRQAVIRFQRRHGLTPDGVAGHQTLEALNVPPAARLKQLQLNLQRWEAAAALQKEPLVLVNIPDYTLHLLDSSGAEVWQTRVVVGQPSPAFQTEPLTSRISYLVLNPSWTVPQSILQREIIPMLQKDLGYLSRNQMQLYRLTGSTRTPLSVQQVNWHTVDLTKDKLLVVQRPGPSNALGHLKFIFANPYQIYLHDTPAKALFAHPLRAYSHGCVRVQDPETLGAYLLSSNWQNRPSSAPLLAQTALEKKLYLPAPVTVQLAYYTCWVDDLGEVQFRKDIYQRDKSLGQVPVL
ncbi:murein L,D-transpeptidase [Rufibacter sediminis]|uniref:L,D-transpeptidase family protein n=1 Tax=Rufibacter sediminis TaxID=2762756 RepID=A0ABR6VVD0_9BACT|nr:L,D-transpeptidase family protein [Rufibacter sediminis]MBC3541152.1 L,D-transpeptidase family protein [Rufibacter sediminis]